MSLSPQINLAVAARFCELLDPSASEQTFQTFDDNAGRKQNSFARVLHGTLDQRKEEMISLNQRGAGVFVTTNQTDLKGRSAKNIIRVRAFFVDTDGAPLAPILKAAKETGIKPFCVVESSPGKFHVYWRAECALDEFAGVQSALAKKFGTDPSVCDLPRVMRLPGFIHQKVSKDGTAQPPFMTRILYPKQEGGA